MISEVEISTEECCEEEDEIGTLMEDPEPDFEEPVRKKRGTRTKQLFFFLMSKLQKVHVCLQVKELQKVILNKAGEG